MMGQKWCIVQQYMGKHGKENIMDEMDKKEIKEVIEWCDEKGHSEHEILELIRRIVGANQREETEE